jgi:hypothetical protein
MTSGRQEPGVLRSSTHGTVLELTPLVKRTWLTVLGHGLLCVESVGSVSGRLRSGVELTGALDCSIMYHTDIYQ